MIRRNRLMAFAIAVPLAVALTFPSCQHTEEIQEPPLVDNLEDGGRKWITGSGYLTDEEWAELLQKGYRPDTVREDNASISDPETAPSEASEEQPEDHGNTETIDDNESSSPTEPAGQDEIIDMPIPEEEASPEKVLIDSSGYKDAASSADQGRSEDTSGNVDIAEHEESSLADTENQEIGSGFTEGSVAIAGELPSPYTGSGDGSIAGTPAGTVSIIHEPVEEEEPLEYMDPNVIFQIRDEKLQTQAERRNPLLSFLSAYGGKFIIAAVLIGTALMIGYLVTFIWNGKGTTIVDIARSRQLKAREKARSRNEVQGSTAPADDSAEVVDDGDVTPAPPRPKAFVMGNIGIGESSEPYSRPKHEDDEEESAADDSKGYAEASAGAASGSKNGTPASPAEGLRSLLDTKTPPRPGEESYPAVMGDAEPSSIENGEEKEAASQPVSSAMESEKNKDEERSEARKLRLSDLLDTSTPKPEEASYPEVLGHSEGESLGSLLDSSTPPRPGEESYPGVLER